MTNSYSRKFFEPMILYIDKVVDVATEEDARVIYGSMILSSVGTFVNSVLDLNVFGVSNYGFIPR